MNGRQTSRLRKMGNAFAFLAGGLTIGTMLFRGACPWIRVLECGADWEMAVLLSGLLLIHVSLAVTWGGAP